MATPASAGAGPLGVDLAQADLAADLFESYARYAAGEIESSPEETRWQAEVDAASAYRTAGQWALLVDPGRARRSYSGPSGLTESWVVGAVVGVSA